MICGRHDKSRCWRSKMQTLAVAAMRYRELSYLPPLRSRFLACDFHPTDRNGCPIKSLSTTNYAITSAKIGATCGQLISDPTRLRSPACFRAAPNGAPCAVRRLGASANVRIAHNQLSLAHSRSQGADGSRLLRKR